MVDFVAMWKNAQANRERLRRCKRHRFVCELSEDEIRVGINTSLQCENCHGALRLLEVLAYIEGYKAAGGKANDILADFE